MEKQIINVTDIVSYLYCPRKVYLKLVKKIKSPPNKRMILGYLKHKIFDIFNKNEAIIVGGINEDLDKKSIFNIYNSHLRAISREVSRNYRNMIKKFGLNEEDLTKEILTFMKKEISLRAESVKKTLGLGFRGKDLWRNLQPKYLTEFQIVSPELGLRGRIDRIKFSGSIVPYEVKTRDEVYEGDKIQLAAYSLLLEQEFNSEIKKGIIETRKREEEIQIAEDLKKKVFEIADKIRNMTDPGFHKNFNKCKVCMLKKDCFEL
jgi:CRISPR-associated exonuclease Cas4